MLGLFCSLTLEGADLKVYKSRSQFIINIMDEYCSKYQQADGKAEGVKAGVYVDDEKYRQEIRDMARDEILHMLGAVIAGSKSVSGGYGQGSQRAGTFQEEKHSMEETEEDLPEDVKNLIGQWSQ